MKEKQKKKPVILVDWDDTISNTCEIWVKELNKEYGTNVNVKDIDEWDFGKKLFPQLTKEEFTSPLHKQNFWQKVSVRSDAATIIPILMEEGYDIYICTATDYRNLKNKVDDLILREFPFFDTRKIICCYDKQLINGDVLIDDNYQNLVGGSYEKILFTSPHNKSIDDKALSCENIWRVNSWKECYFLLHSLHPTEN